MDKYVRTLRLALGGDLEDESCNVHPYMKLRSGVPPARGKQAIGAAARCLAERETKIFSSEISRPVAQVTHNESSKPKKMPHLQGCRNGLPFLRRAVSDTNAISSRSSACSKSSSFPHPRQKHRSEVPAALSATSRRTPELSLVVGGGGGGACRLQHVRTRAGPEDGGTADHPELC